MGAGDSGCFGKTGAATNLRRNSFLVKCCSVCVETAPGMTKDPFEKSRAGEQ
jgi:hypothetical protein